MGSSRVSKNLGLSGCVSDRLDFLIRQHGMKQCISFMDRESTWVLFPFHLEVSPLATLRFSS